MTKKQLLKALESSPDDAEICIWTVGQIAVGVRRAEIEHHFNDVLLKPWTPLTEAPDEDEEEEVWDEEARHE